MASHVFYRPGGASRRVAGVILHALGLHANLPDDVEEVSPRDASSSPKEL